MKRKISDLLLFIPVIGIIIIFLVLAVFICFQALYAKQFILSNIYFLKIFQFTLFYSIIVAFISVFIGFFLIGTFNKLLHSNYWRHFCNLISLPFHMPSIVICLALISVFGNSGYISLICKFFNLKYSTFLYGKLGILLSLTFYYVPYVMQNFNHVLNSININTQLTTILNIKGFNFVRLILFPSLKKNIVKNFFLIILYAMRSVTSIMIFSNGPWNINLEIAILQKMNYDNDLYTASQLALLQLIISLVLFLITKQQKINLISSPISFYNIKSSKNIKFSIYDLLSIGIMFFLFIAPIFSFLFKYFNFKSVVKVFSDTLFWKSLGVSCLIGFVTCIISSFLCTYNLFTFYNLSKYKNNFMLTLLDLYINLPMIFSPMIFFVSFGIFATRSLNSFYIIIFFIGIMNSIYYSTSFFNIYYTPFMSAVYKYNHLIRYFNIRGINFFKFIIWPNMKHTIFYCLISCMVFSLGDFKSGLFLQNSNVSTFILLIYDKIKDFEFDYSFLVCSLLLLISFLLFSLSNLLKNNHE